MQDHEFAKYVRQAIELEQDELDPPGFLEAQAVDLVAKYLDLLEYDDEPYTQYGTDEVKPGALSELSYGDADGDRLSLQIYRLYCFARIMIDERHLIYVDRPVRDDNDVRLEQENETNTQ